MARPVQSDAKLAKRLCTRGADFANYDVFISHRGPDTKTGFVGFLYKALRRAGLYPFLDCESIGISEDSWQCIDHAIQVTPLALVIFSENFAQSEWCLRELHAMLDCRSMKVLPIYYNVEPWEVQSPENGQLATGFKKLVEEQDETLVEQWKADLNRASTIHGWEHKVGDGRLEADLVQEVVKEIFELANKLVPLVVGDHIVGLKQVAENLIQTLDEKKVLMLGLWGMGGIGKSTLARELYNQLGRRFDARCYVGDLVETVNQDGVRSVQNHILKALCDNESMPDTLDKSQGKGILEERLSKKQILLVLDDVRDDDEMGYLISHKMLKEGSMCIVTSRDRRVFEESTSFHLNDEVHTHEVQTLSEQDSQSLFACHVFGGDEEVPQEFEVLVGAVSKACGGVPLVLEVCGSRLRGERGVEIWKEVLDKLICGSIMDNEKKIFNCFRISYDALSWQYQEMFLDIACALLGKSVEMAKAVWRSQGWFAALGVRSLVEKALVRVDEEGDFHMHDHLRDMGRAIARQERTRMGICKRLCNSESLALLDKNELLPDSLQTLILRPNHKIQVDLSPMAGLRILHCANCLSSMSSLPKSLRWLHYTTYLLEPLGHFPEALANSELVILFWWDDRMERLSESFGNLRKLEVLNLSGSSGLVDLPNSFGGLQNLKNLDLRGSGIQSLPESFGMLSNLEVLNLRSCSRLKKLSDSFGGLLNLKNVVLERSGILNLPESFGMLRKLEMLNLRGCSKLEKLSYSFGVLPNLKYLDLRGSAIHSLLESFGNLRKLEVLNLWDCSKLEKLPNSFGGLQKLTTLDLGESRIQSLPESFGMLSSLEVLNLRDCGKLEKLLDVFGGLLNLKNVDLKGSVVLNLLESFGMLRKLEVLNLRYCSKLEKLPDSFGGLSNLNNLDLKISGIQSLPESFGNLRKLEVLSLWGCIKLEKLPNSFGGLQNLTNLDLGESGIQSLPESFGMLSNLEVLNLWNCSWLRNLPDSFGGLQNLKNLNLRRSGVQRLPESFGNLRKLEVLILQGSNKLPKSFLKG